jgi:hypothetical protein
MSWGQRTKLEYDSKMKEEVKSVILIGSAYGELALRAFGRSQGSRWFGRRIIDLDPPPRLLTHDLLYFPLKRWSSGSFAFPYPSPRQSGTGPYR